MLVNPNMSGINHAAFFVRFVRQLFQDAFENSELPPASKACMDGFPGPISGRQIAPWSAGTIDPKHGIYHVPIVVSRSSFLSGSLRWQQVDKTFPLVVAKFVAIIGFHTSVLTQNDGV